MNPTLLHLILTSTPGEALNHGCTALFEQSMVLKLPISFISIDVIMGGEIIKPGVATEHQHQQPPGQTCEQSKLNHNVHTHGLMDACFA